MICHATLLGDGPPGAAYSRGASLTAFRRSIAGWIPTEGLRVQALRLGTCSSAERQQTAALGVLSNSSYPMKGRRSVPYCANPPKLFTVPAPLVVTFPKTIEH